MSSCSLTGLAAALLVLLAACTPSITLAQSTKNFTNTQCTSSQDITLLRLGSYFGNATGSGSVEVLAYHAPSRTVALVEATSKKVSLIDISNPSKPTLKGSKIEMQEGAVPNSVAISGDVLAIAADAATNATDPGSIHFYRLPDGTPLTSVLVCAMPDNIVFSKNGSKLYVACEGEPSTQSIAPSDPLVGANPPGEIGVVAVTRTASGAFVSAQLHKRISLQAYLDTLTATQWDGLLSGGLHVDARLLVTEDRGKSQAALDLEPEYIALHESAGLGYVALQENNAVAAFDLVKEEVVGIWPLGYKDWSLHPADLSDKDKALGRLQTWPGMRGLYQPDTIKLMTISGKPYLFLANEGDSKEEKMRAGGLTSAQLDASFPNAASWDSALKNDTGLGRVNISPLCGLAGPYNTSKPINQQGPYRFLCTYGARSFSILDATTGALVFESGSDLETMAAQQAPTCPNCDRDKNDPDARSDDAGPEPEALEVATMPNGRTYAFVGLERQGGVVIYDVTTPASARFVTWHQNRNYSIPKEVTINTTNAPSFGDLAPEGLLFVPAADSPNGAPLLLMAAETSGGLVVHEVRTCGAKSSAAAAESDEDDDDKKKRDIGLGVGLGVGIPVVLALIGAAWYIASKSGNASGAAGKYAANGKEPSPV